MATTGHVHIDAFRRACQSRTEGALEYAGELALTKGDVATAEPLLGRLVRARPPGCEERAALERAVARFKAQGRPQ